jgi:asparagine synthase (glutamine-hydrolysing)
MLRYVVVLWNERALAQAQLVQRMVARLRAADDAWRCRFEGTGVLVYCTGDGSLATSVQELSGRRGVILGALFRRGAGTGQGASVAVRAINEQDSAAIAASDGRELIDRYWGNYVAIVNDPSRRATTILRGPVSSLPSMHVSAHGVDVYYSFQEDCCRLELLRFTVNWDYVTLHMIGRVSNEKTGLREVSQLRPGESVVHIGDSKTKRVYWDHVAIARARRLDDVDQATAALRASLKDCAHAWASCYDSILLALSGGLDSSIVLACLRDAPSGPRLNCFTEYSSGADSDERAYARSVARIAKLNAHFEELRNPVVSLEPMLQMKRSAIPEGSFRRAELARAHALLARRCNASAIFSGHGGDQLFFQSSARLTAADFLWQRGISAGLGSIVYSSAQNEERSVWWILKDAIANRVRARRYDPLVARLEYKNLIAPKVAQDLRSHRFGFALPPQPTRDVPTGKMHHIYAISDLGEYYDPMSAPGDPEHIAPLLSQPVIETALSIPTYLLMFDGWDRGLVRRAFEAELPVEIVRRRSKGGMSEHMQEIFRRNRAFIRDLLLDGQLVRQGLLDRGRVAAALGDKPSSAMRGEAELIHCLCIEAWLRTWTENAQSAAA